jgi:hypothetical protein
VNAPIDRLHAECLVARNEIRAEFVRLQMAADTWVMAECPPRANRLLRPLAVWLDEQTAVPVTRPEFVPLDDAFKVWDGDDPLLRPKGWLR